MIELLVTMVISFALIAGVASLFLSSNASYRLNEARLRLQQDGRYAMLLMESNLRQAGFGHLTSASVNAAEIERTDFVRSNGKPGQGLRGCDAGFEDPLSYKFGCHGGEGSASFEVAYRVADTFVFDNSAGADCNGSKAGVIDLPKSHPAYNIRQQVAVAMNRFFVATPSGSKTKSLYCHGNTGNGLNIAQPILNNVEDMRLSFGVAEIGGFSAQQFLSATDVEALSTDQHQNWKRVVRVKLCLQLHAPESSRMKQHYVDCRGIEQAKSDGLRAVMTSIINLRNNTVSIE
ncbi:PilW family protein [Glaciimonas sp. GG7]